MRRLVPALLLLLVLVACETVPVTGRRELLLFPEANERDMGLTSYQEVLKKSKVSADPRLNDQVTRVGRRIACGLHRQYGDEHPGDEFGFIEAVAWLLMYVFVNLQLSPNRLTISGIRASSTSGFYWLTYGLIWLLPLLGLFLALRSKHRAMLDVNIVLALATLITNKPYLHIERKPWDPIVFGVLLIGVAVAIRRWLDRGAQGYRGGFTSVRLLSSDKRRLGMVAAASVAFQPGVSSGPTPAPERPFDPGGGRSGGGGASGSFE